MLSIYLAHPFDSRKYVRDWELFVETKYNINLINPFYDISREDVEAIDRGFVDRYEALEPKELVKRDLSAIIGSDGVIAIVDGALSCGTIMEIVYAKMLNKTIDIIITNGHELHPWLLYHATNIYTSLGDYVDAVEGIE